MAEAAKKLTFIDLFAGCGGLSEGFLKSGHYQALAHVEWEKPMVDTLRNRLVKAWGHSEEDAKERVIQFDVQKTEELIKGSWSQKSRDEYGANNALLIQDYGLRGVVGGQHVDLVIGGPPCQAYSIAGRAQDAKGMKDDYRNYLFESFVKIVDYFKPKAFVFENVPGILTARPGKKKDNPFVTELIYRAFRKIGYEIRKPSELARAIFCASDFGVPQKRNRVIIVGVRKDCGLNLEKLYASLLLHTIDGAPKTVRDAIGKMPKLLPLGTDEKIGNAHVSHKQEDGTNSIDRHVPRYHNKRDRSIFYEWLSKNLNHASQEFKLDYYTRIVGPNSNHIKYRNLEWDKPSPTIVSHLYKDGLMFIHPDINQIRSITMREAALLQSFPIDYEFIGSNAYAFKMIGNAVPVDFAKGIADSVYDVLKDAE